MKNILYTILFLGWSRLCFAQTIQKVEYFIDTDPGFGSGINVPITGGSTVSANLSIPLSIGLTSGFHKFYIRAKNSNGVWSMVNAQNFFKTNDLPTIQNIVELEYFIDTDAGYGQGINIPITPNTTVNQGLNIALPSDLANGFHKFFIRAKEASGKWSTVFAQSFFKTNDLPSIQNIVKLEYFIDVDAGFGNGIDIPITPSTSVTTPLNIPIPANLPLGFHKFFIRGKDANGKWSVVHAQNFYITNELSNVQNITKLEYFIGADPGFGQGTQIAITPGLSISAGNTLFNVPNSIGLGSHQLTLRGQDANGKWSIVANKSFINCPGVSISAPNGLLSCTDPLPLNALKTNPELNGSLAWFRNGIALNSSNSSITALESGKYSVKLSTAECSNISSPEVQVNIVGGTIIKLKSSKPEMLCNENLVISIDSANSNLPVGIPALFSWFRDGNALTVNSSSSTQSTTQPGVYKAKVNFSIFSNSCLSFDSDSIRISNRNLSMSISPQTSTNNLLVCTGNSVNLQANDNFQETITYKWFKNTTLLPSETTSQLMVNNSSGQYLVKGSIGACVDIPSAVLNLSYGGIDVGVPTISAQENLSTTFCGGDTLHLSATGCSSQTIWWNGKIGPSITHALEGTSFITARCSDGCLGNTSNQLVANSNGFKGNPSPLEAATLPFPANYRSLSKVDFINTYDGAQLVGMKSLFGGGRLFFGSSNGPIFADNLTQKGESDFFIRQSLTTNSGGTFSFFGGSGNDWMNGFIETEPHTYLMFGYSDSPISGDISQAGFGSLDFWMIKYNYFSGNKVYDKRFGGTGIDIISSVTKTSNGTLFLAGTTTSGISGNKTTANFGQEDFWVVKTDANGNKLAEFTYGGNQKDELKSISKINDNLFLLFGTSNSGISGNKTVANLNNSQDYWAIWIDANGSILHQEVYGGNSNETAIKALVLKDGNIIFSGHSASEISGAKSQNARGENDFWVIKTNANGQKIWDKTLGGIKDEVLVAMDSTVEGNLVFLGNTKTITPSFERQSPGFSHGSLNEIFVQDVWLIELNQNGDIITDYILGSCGYDVSTPLLETESGDLFCMPTITRTFNCSINYLDIGGINQRYPVLLKLNKAIFKNPDENQFCKTVFVRASTASVHTGINSYGPPSANQYSSYASQLEWSNGQTSQFFKTVLSDSIKLSFRYLLMGKTCFSRISTVHLKRYADILTLSGVEGSVLNDLPTKQFAYKLLESNRSVINPASYTSEGGIELQPGFEIKATVNKTFEAKIGGCINP
ncbi:hypothetical protein [Lacihabitans lacunae]|uniref:Ig-like domain-containing protein n=1 Tax=Lacihabitans lacunae TaxID=1028214 RepID=A0ABV7YQL2_9BACT